MTGQYVCGPRSQCKESSSNAGGETALCSVHYKNRSMVSLEPDEFGGYKCQASARCKIGGAGGGGGIYERTWAPHDSNQTGICCMHYKSRSWSSLVENGYGQYRCSPMDQCKIQEDMPVAAPPVPGVNLGPPPASDEFVAAPTVVVGEGVGLGAPGPTGVPGTAICSAHNKPRSVTCMMEDGSGGHICTAEHECK